MTNSTPRTVKLPANTRCTVLQLNGTAIEVTGHYVKVQIDGELGAHEWHALSVEAADLAARDALITASRKSLRVTGRARA